MRRNTPLLIRPGKCIIFRGKLASAPVRESSLAAKAPRGEDASRTGKSQKTRLCELICTNVVIAARELDRHERVAVRQV